MGYTLSDIEKLNAVSLLIEKALQKPQLAVDLLNQNNNRLQLQEDYILLSVEYDLLLKQYENLKEFHSTAQHSD